MFASALAVAGANADWENFKATYAKVYNSPDHEAKQRQVYEVNMQWAAENSNDETTFGETQFADLTQEQYRVEAGLGYKPSPVTLMPQLGVHEYNGEELADTIDWTTNGAVTNVKNQKQCGSCWAFSTTGALEGAWQIETGKLTYISEQQFVDCDSGLLHPNHGCNGGSMQHAFHFAHKHDIATEDSYPYKGHHLLPSIPILLPHCKKEKKWDTAIPKGGVTGYRGVGQSAEALKSAIQQGPVSVAIEADQAAFQHYNKGIITGLINCGPNLDHGVLAVGYGSGYFKVKNSWGSRWGEHGYVRISDSGDTCGILQQASYPVVSASVGSAVV
jgi:C1A family cysteine protease